MKEVQLYDVDESSISPVTSAHSVYMDDESSVHDSLDNIVNTLENRLGLRRLWRNTVFNSEFAEQDIVLSSGNYDYLIFVYEFSLGSDLYQSAFSMRGFNTRLAGVSCDNGGTVCAYRDTRYSSDATTVKISDCKISRGSAAYSTDNFICVPYLIYGGKF